MESSDLLILNYQVNKAFDLARNDALRTRGHSSIVDKLPTDYYTNCRIDIRQTAGV